MITVFKMEDGSAELETVDILATRDEFLRPFNLPSLQLLSVAESECARVSVTRHLA
ncbi:hypothetical protein [Iodobacter fluviatilis]|jgi:hypothetical protein|uniref:hypothetical protein n=1 Tax=Iodobacter fluviatilis TaxID=537 RepID=UPI00165E9792|nr:hypothetical protein [Iodobacter fluviatilis]